MHAWPEAWYAWRLLMPALAHDFQVVAVDQRGIGLSDKPEDGYDTATLANDMVALMDVLGHKRFAVIGCDTGLLISYAIAAPRRRCSSPRESSNGSGTSPSTSSRRPTSSS